MAGPMSFVFTVTVSVDRDSGKFASRDELEAWLQEALEDANPDSYSGDNGGEYSVTDWNVTA